MVVAEGNKRSRKRTSQAVEAVRTRERYRYLALAGDALRSLNVAALDLELVDARIIGDLSGNPDGMLGWLILASRSQSKRARTPGLFSQLESMSRRALIKAGLPSSAVRTFELKITSGPEVQVKGGSFGFFRQ
jgi:hypothetical protein